MQGTQYSETHPTAHLDPLIASRLAEFQRRRRRLLLIKGGLALVAALLLTMLVVGLADWLFLLPDSVRLALSLVAYGCTFAVAWKTSLASLVKPPDAKALALLVENVDPKLREQLLSAVELGDFEEGRVPDSEEFRLALQKQVAGRMRVADMNLLLPFGLLRRWVLAAALVVGGLFLLALIPGFRLAPLLGRALLPAANFDRISRTQVTFLLPAPPDQTVPGGDSVSVEISLSGSVPDKARIETFSENGHSERVPMQRTAEGTFRAELDPGTNSLEYRILAGDAVTKKYQLTVAERPRVVSFTKTYRPPAYSGQSQQVVTSPDGNVSGIESGSVDLVLTTDQPIASARFEILGAAAENTSPVPVEVRGPNTLAAMLPLTRSGSYRVRLTAKGTGFENKFSPEYPIDVQADLVPSVRIDLPQGDQTIPPGGVVRIVGEASDDVGLLSVTQETRSNGGEWVASNTLSNRPTSPMSVDWNWDLESLDLRTGDEIFTRLTATDLKNNSSHSNIIRILIASTGTDPADTENLRAREELQKLLSGVTSAADDSQKKARELIQAGRETPPVERERLLAGARDALAQLDEAQARAEQATRELAQKISDSMGAEDMVLVAKATAKTRNAFIDEAREALEKLSASETDEGDRQKRNLEKALNAAETNARRVENAHKTMLQADQAEAVGEALATTQEGIANGRPLVDAAKADEKFAARATGAAKAAAAELAQTARDMAPLAANLDGGDRNQVNDLAKALTEQSTQAMTILDSRPETGAAATANQQLAEAVSSARNRIEPLQREFSRRARDAARDLEHNTGTAAAAVDELKRDLGEAAKLPEAAAAEAKQQAFEKAATRVGEMADIEELSPKADAQEVRDLAAAERALEKIAKTDPQNVDSIDAVKKALDTVEVSADARALQRQLADSAGADSSHPSPAEQAADWARLQEALEATPDQLARAGLPQEPANALRDAARGDSARAVREEMDRRSDLRRQQEPVAAPLEKLAQAAAAANAAMAPLAQQASEALEAMAPSIQEMAAEAASETGQLALDSLAASAAQAGAQPAAELQQRQQSASQEIATIEEALRREAHAQDLASSEGRAAARDSDDALAMLAGKATAADEALQQAAAAPDQAAATAPLQAAAQQQAQLSDALRQIASHFGAETPAATRQAMRDAEAPLGAQEQMDAQYGELENIAEMMPLSPAEQLAALEAELARNQEMQAALGDIAAQSEQAGSEALRQAAAAERAAAANFSAAAGQQPNAPEPAAQAAAGAQPSIAAGAAQAAADLASAARHQERLGNQPESSELSQAAAQASQAATGAVPAASAALQGMPQSAPANQALAGAVSALETPLSAMAKSPPAGATGSSDPQANALAQALDQLDAAMNPAAGQPAAGQAVASGQPAPASPGTAALASAMQAQGAAMQAGRMQQAAAKAGVPTPGSPGSPKPGASMAGPTQPGSPSSQPSQNPGQSDGPDVSKDSAALNPSPVATTKEWGTLPSRVAEDLSQGTRESVSTEYRAQVDAYFRAISEKAASK